ncbi:aldo/keto reductase [Actinomyces minihominis]|uniref:aldo/keto reductase n=1 Tax=Actinomyces minihominis TaxID=2002838 RepID=UPI000C0751B3|nr:aldo/keto reductase [Actinomyces minihominis]
MTAIGLSNLDVYPLCLGTNSFGWTADLAGACSVLDEYTENGGNFIDTADVYGRHKAGNVGGESEEMIGHWLSGRPREELVIASKVGFMKPSGELSVAAVRRGVEGSLRRLGTDYIDLYYAHKFDPETPVAESVEVFAEEQAAGRIREVGLSNMTPEQIRNWIAEADRQGVARPVALQPPYNLLNRVKYETEWQPVVEEFSLGVMTYWSLAGGLLTGKYASTAAIVGERAGTVNRHAGERAFEVVEAVRQIASEHNVDPAAVAVAWLLENPTVTAPVASARSAAQVGPLMEGVTIQLTPSNLELLNRLSEGLNPENIGA